MHSLVDTVSGQLSTDRTTVGVARLDGRSTESALSPSRVCTPAPDLLVFDLAGESFGRTRLTNLGELAERCEASPRSVATRTPADGTAPLR
jgi:hypothetical protein